MATEQEIINAVVFAIEQENTKTDGVINRNLLVDNVRKYFDKNNIECDPIDFVFLQGYLEH